MMRMERLSILVLLLLLLAAPCLAQSGGSGPPEQQPNSIKPPQATPTRGLPNENLKKSPQTPPKKPSLPIGVALIVGDPSIGDHLILESLKGGDLIAFNSMLADDAIEVTSQGVHTKAQIIESLKEARLMDYTIADVKARQVDNDTVLVTYRTTGKFSVHGREQAYNAQAATLWVKRNDRWLALFHQETSAATGH